MKRLLIAAAAASLLALAAAPASAQEPNDLAIERERTLQEAFKTVQVALGVVKSVAEKQPAYVNFAPAPQAAAQDTVSPLAIACEKSMWACGVQALASMGSGGVEMVKALVGPGSNVAIARYAKKAEVEMTRENNITSRSNNANDNATLQLAFSRLGDAAGRPSTVNNVTNSQGVNTGAGSQTYAPETTTYTNSQNPVNPAPRVCGFVPGPNSTSVFTCTGG